MEKNNFVVKTKNLKKSFGKVQALNSVSLNVPEHSIFGFLGPNGAGKTTFIKILLGLSRPTAGTAEIFGLDIIKDSVEIRERIGYLPQRPRYIEYMTARENLELTTRFFNLGSKKEINERCNEMLALVGLEEKADRPIKHFSGGEKQRLGIALAKINYPELLILDEPVSSLDPIGRQEVFEVMEQLRNRATILFSTHILDDVQRISDTVAILNHGNVEAYGPIDQLLNGKQNIEYVVTVRDVEAQLGSHLSTLDWVKRTSINRRNGHDVITWKIEVNNPVIAENNLLSYIQSDGRFLIMEFNRRKNSLEEVFMNLIRGVGNVN